MPKSVTNPGMAPTIHSDWVDDARLTVVVGHFGSGKSEFSVNLALALAAKGHPFYLADLDVVDPYFRSRECKMLLEAHGGKLITSSQACMDADVPSLPAEVMTVLEDTSRFGILDIGGDASGARVLARYRRQLLARNARVLCVLNANRPLTDAPERGAEYLRSIEAAAGLRVTGLVNNTHLCHMTEERDVAAGADYAAAVSALTGVPVVCHAWPRRLDLPADRFPEPGFPMEIYLKKPWE